MATYRKIRPADPASYIDHAEVGPGGVWGTVREDAHAKRLLADGFLIPVEELVARSREQFASLPPGAWSTGYQLQIAFRLLADAQLVDDGAAGMVAFLRLHSGGRRPTQEYRTYRSYVEHAARLIRSEVELGADVESWKA